MSRGQNEYKSETSAANPPRMTPPPNGDYLV